MTAPPDEPPGAAEAGTLTGPADHGVRAPLRYRDFRGLAAGRSLMYFGNALVTVALAFAVLDLPGGSPVDLGIVLGARSMALVVFALLGGVLADRLPRSVILQGACGLAAASQAAIAASVLTGVASVPLLAALSVVNGTVAAVGLPAAVSLTPQTVPPHLLRQANAVARMGLMLGLAAGMSAGGGAVGLVGPGWALAFTAAVFAAAGAAFHFVRVAPPSAGERGHPLRELAEGWTEFTARPWVWVVVLQFMVVNAVWSGGVKVLGPAVADATIGRGLWGVVLSAETVGAVVGGLLAARWQPRRALLFGVSLTALDALPLLTLGYAPSVPFLLPAMFLTGVALEQFGVAWEVSVQQNIPPDKLARVYSYDALGSFVALPIGETLAGPLAALVGTRTTLTGGAVLIGLACLATLSVRGVRTLTAR
ncbi:MFS transporter [Streptomonospora litoralis]|uniref:Enterobactin exporter EntS n=1 Tax=Streptomonospora litoralis TaxID=2498135 RepID=A0A4P6Q4M6_9ACTN|nr:MFS transporter [Streptomonospora litoralis]QBI55656.1 enterobactin exporter EntS [Streptomonospora litoralis]